MRLLPEQIKTGRMLLREPLEADAEAIFSAYAQDPVVCRYLDWAPHTSLDVTRRFIAECLEAWSIGHRLPYVIADPGSNEVLGMIEARILSTTVDIGYVLARSRWGSGLMPEAIEAVASACLARPEIFRVQALCDVENHASARALEKSGFAREGRLARYGVHPNVSPEPRDCFMYARLGQARW
jgi:RimJ/RimL family protein N-acetyltransferase